MLAGRGLESPKFAHILVSDARTSKMETVRFDLISTNIQYGTCM